MFREVQKEIKWRRIQRRGFWLYWAAAEGSVVAVDFATVGEVGEPTFTYNRDSVRKFALVRRQALPSPAHTGYKGQLEKPSPRLCIGD